MAPGRGYRCASGAGMASGKTGGQRATRRRRAPRRAAGREVEGIALLAGRQLTDVASSTVLVMGRLSYWRVKVQLSGLRRNGT